MTICVRNTCSGKFWSLHIDRMVNSCCSVFPYESKLARAALTPCCDIYLEFWQVICIGKMHEKCVGLPSSTVDVSHAHVPSERV